MAVPKRRVSSARRDKRRSNVWKMDAPELVKCPQCGEYKRDQALGADTDHVGHIGVRQTRSHHQRPGNFNNFTAQIR